MGSILSVFFSTERTYLTLVKQTPRALKLEYINSTEMHFPFENPDSDEFRDASNEFLGLLSEITGNIGRLSVSLPTENALITQFKGEPDLSLNELKYLFDLEIRQAYPQFSYDKFIATIIPLSRMKDGTPALMAFILSKSDIEAIKRLFSSKRIVVDNIEITQLNAGSAFLYNYPEFSAKTCAIIGVQPQFADFSLISSGKLLYYNLIAIKNKSMFGELCKDEILKTYENHASSVDAVFLFGTGLNKQILDDTALQLKDIVPHISRLNAFRLMNSGLDKRVLDYCIRTAHIFPPCIGGAVNPFYERVKLY